MLWEISFLSCLDFLSFGKNLFKGQHHHHHHHLSNSAAFKSFMLHLTHSPTQLQISPSKLFHSSPMKRHWYFTKKGILISVPTNDDCDVYANIDDLLKIVLYRGTMCCVWGRTAKSPIISSTRSSRGNRQGEKINDDYLRKHIILKTSDWDVQKYFLNKCI